MNVHFLILHLKILKIVRILWMVSQKVILNFLKILRISMVLHYFILYATWVVFPIAWVWVMLMAQLKWHLLYLFLNFYFQIRCDRSRRSHYLEIGSIVERDHTTYWHTISIFKVTTPSRNHWLWIFIQFYYFRRCRVSFHIQQAHNWLVRCWTSNQ